MSRAWMPLYVGDYLADTQHLTTLQHGAYVLLIMHYWTQGGLPDNEQAIARICGLNRGAWESNRQAIAKLFLPGWKHKRIDRELERFNQISAKRALAGYKGGKASRGKNNGERFISQAIARQAGGQSQSHKNLSSESEEWDAPQGAGEKEAASVASLELAALNRRRGWA